MGLLFYGDIRSLLIFLVGISSLSGSLIHIVFFVIPDFMLYFFQELPSPALIHEAVYAFKAAVQQTATESVSTKYKVVGSKGRVLCYTPGNGGI